MKLLLILPVLILTLIASPTSAQTGCARVSWGSCDPWNENSCWAGPGHYQLVVSTHGTGIANMGYDTNLHMGAIVRNLHCYEGYPDAWRFDDGGCEGAGRLTITSDGLNPACPAMKSTHPLTFADVSKDNAGELDIRMATTYDPVSPDPQKSYTLWVLDFDLTHASAGPSPADLSTCGFADKGCGNFYLTFALLLDTTNQLRSLGGCDSDNLYFSPNQFPSGFATWNGGCLICDEFGVTRPNNCAPVPALSPSWGRVKAMYR